MSPAHRRILASQALLGLAANFVLNGASAWATFPPVPAMPLWARGNCVAGGIIGTSFFLPLTTCIVLTPFARGALRRGSLAPLAREALPAGVRALPASMAGRGALVGLLCALTLGPAACWLVGSFGVTELSRGGDALFKAVYSALLGMLVTPLFGLRALADVAPPARPAGSPD